MVLKDPREQAEGGCMSGRVVVVIRAYPTSVMENLEPLVKKIGEKLPKDKYVLMKWEPVEIAFGYRAVDLYIVMPENLEGGTEEVEEAIKSVEGIDNVDIIYVSRLGP